jgi:hypothetical protein
MIPGQFVFVGTLLSLIGLFNYSKSIIKGTTRPDLVSWILWMLAPLTAAFFQLKAGAGFSAVPTFVAGFGPVIVLTVAALKKNGFWKITSFDIVCGSLALVALIFYIKTHNLNISIIFAILSDALAFIPTLKKSWTNPESESVHGYVWCVLSNTIGILTIKNWSFVIASFGIYLIISNSLEVLVLYRKKITSTFSRTLLQS